MLYGVDVSVIICREMLSIGVLNVKGVDNPVFFYEYCTR